MDTDLVETLGSDFYNFNNKMFVALADFGINIIPVSNEPMIYSSTKDAICAPLEFRTIEFKDVDHCLSQLHQEYSQFLEHVPCVSSYRRQHTITYRYPERVSDHLFKIEYCFLYIT